MEATLKEVYTPGQKRSIMNAVAGLLRGRSIILKITRARNSIKFSKIHSSGRDWLRAAAAWRGPARDHWSGG